jgi:hypothetical protein
MLGVGPEVAVADATTAVEIPSDHLENIGTLVGRRITRFLTTTPDEAHNRRRLLFILITFFVICILVTLGSFVFNTPTNTTPANTTPANTTLELIKNFTSAILWLAGIYVGGTVAAMAVDKPKVTATSDISRDVALYLD